MDFSFVTSSHINSQYIQGLSEVFGPSRQSGVTLNEHLCVDVGLALEFSSSVPRRCISAVSLSKMEGQED